jgi:hypothetical protein
MGQDKIDVFGQFAAEYAAKKEPCLMEVDQGWYLGLDGYGDPDEPAFKQAVAGLYAVAYAMKSAAKSAGQDFKVAKLEGLWNAPPEYQEFTEAPRDMWYWTLLIRMPDFLCQADLEAAKQKTAAKGRGARQAYLTLMDEGRCVQILHVGPYAQMGPSIKALRNFAQAKGLSVVGRHHEIYLSDPGKTAPEKLKTILRLPVM